MSNLVSLDNFKLNRDFNTFEGKIKWLGSSIRVYLVLGDNKSENAGHKALDTLNVLLKRQRQEDLEMRTFAADELTDLANNWAEDDEEITEEDFANRICILELSVNTNGKYTAYFNTDNMFADHAIVALMAGQNLLQFRGERLFI